MKRPASPILKLKPRSIGWLIGTRSGYVESISGESLQDVFVRASNTSGRYLGSSQSMTLGGVQNRAHQIDGIVLWMLHWLGCAWLFELHAFAA
jgi:hypothetical protein